MSKSTIAKIIFILIAIPTLFYFSKNFIKEKEERLSKTISDAKNIKGVIKIGYDSWQGYSFICSPSMVSEMQKRGYLLKCIDTNFEERFNKLYKGDLDFALATMDTMILNSKNRVVGAVVSLIDESNGGDAILSKKFKTLNGLKMSGFSVGLVGDSPSSFLWSVVSEDFNINGASIHTYQNEDKLKEAIREDKEDVIVTWEPLVSKAQKWGYHKLIGSENISGLIIDVLVASKDTISKNPEKIYTLLSTYFAIFNRIVKRVDGLKMYGITENNSLWSDDYVVKSLINIANRLKVNIDNPYTLVNSSFIKGVVQFSKSHNDKYSLSIQKELQKGFKGYDFKPLTDEEWKRLSVVGNLKQEKISFATGTAYLTLEAKEKLEKIANIINQYRYYVLIKGHTSLMGDPKANKILSEERALAVYNYLTRVLGVNKNRLKYVGMGSEEPLPRREGESLRNYNQRLKRVEFIFLKR